MFNYVINVLYKVTFSVACVAAGLLKRDIDYIVQKPLKN